MNVFLLLLPTAHATNVLFIIADDLGASKINGFTDPASTAYYLPNTPAIDDLRTAGITFTDAWANPECSPTRAGLHTGYPAYVNGVGEALGPADEVDYQIIDSAYVTLAESSRAAGVKTAAFGKWHIGTPGSLATTDWELTASDPDQTVLEKPHPVQAGFQTYVGDLSGIVAAYDGWSVVAYPGSSGAGSTDQYWETANADDVLVDEATNWINGWSVGDSWLAMVNFYSPHSEAPLGPYATSDYDASCPSPGAATDLNGDGSTGDDTEKLVYQTLVECTDARIHSLLSGITPALLEDTVIVFMGDNGAPESVLEGEYADAGTRTANGKGSVYESGVRVPLITTDGETWLQVQNGQPLTSDVYPNPGDTFDTPVTTTDMHDTAMGFLEASRGLTTFSRDIGPYLATATVPVVRPPNGIYTEYFNVDWATTSLSDDSAAAFKSGTWKLVMNVESGGTCISRQLYDLSTDPYERTDVAGSNAAKVTSLYSAVTAKGIPWLPTTIC